MAEIVNGNTNSFPIPPNQVPKRLPPHAIHVEQLLATFPNVELPGPSQQISDVDLERLRGDILSESRRGLDRAHNAHFDREIRDFETNGGFIQWVNGVPNELHVPADGLSYVQARLANWENQGRRQMVLDLQDAERVIKPFAEEDILLERQAHDNLMLLKQFQDSEVAWMILRDDILGKYDEWLERIQASLKSETARLSNVGPALGHMVRALRTAVIAHMQGEPPLDNGGIQEDVNAAEDGPTHLAGEFHSPIVDRSGEGGWTGDNPTPLGAPPSGPENV